MNSSWKINDRKYMGLKILRSFKTSLVFQKWIFKRVHTILMYPLYVFLFIGCRVSRIRIFVPVNPPVRYSSIFLRSLRGHVPVYPFFAAPEVIVTMFLITGPRQFSHWHADGMFKWSSWNLPTFHIHSPRSSWNISGKWKPSWQFIPGPKQNHQMWSSGLFIFIGEITTFSDFMQMDEARNPRDFTLDSGHRFPDWFP